MSSDDIVTRLREACAHLCKRECGRENAYGVAVEAADEIERLRQGIWDACIHLGMDADGNDTPRHLAYPPLAELVVQEAQSARQDYDELLDELAEVEGLRAAGDALHAAIRNHDLTEAHLKAWLEARRG